MGMPAETTRRWTAREVRDLIAAQPNHTPRYELVDGELLVTPSPAFIHQRAVTTLLVALAAYFERNPIGIVLTSPSDVELEPEDIRQPDVFVVPLDEVKRVHRDGNPVRQLLLAIEVLSPSSSRNDRVKKRPGYQRHVAEYWIFDLDARLVEKWRPGDARPEVLAHSLEWKPEGARDSFTLALAPFFASAHGEDL
jgi:Uma2 family endonuclease